MPYILDKYTCSPIRNKPRIGAGGEK